LVLAWGIRDFITVIPASTVVPVSTQVQAYAGSTGRLRCEVAASVVSAVVQSAVSMEVELAVSTAVELAASTAVADAASGQTSLQ
jgi:hypothetical protein